MRRLFIVGGLLVVFCSMAGSSFAGTVYVLLVAPDASYETRISVANPSSNRIEFNALLLAAGSDGTDRTSDGDLILLNSGNTWVTKTDPGFRGLLELSGDAELIADARLVRVGTQDAGVQVPIITSKNIATANTQAFLQGWVRDADHEAGFGVVNLGDASADCTVQVRKVQGAALVSNAIFQWNPLTLRHFGDDVLGALGDFRDVRAHVFCDQPFYTYGTTTGKASSELVVFGHSALGSSTLSLPNEGPVCTPGAVCFERQGVFHVPTSGNLVARLFTTPPAGTYKVIHATLSVLNGGWSPNRTSGTHNIFWLARDGNRDLFGYVNVQGPSKNEMFLRHGIDLTQGQKPKVTQGFVMNPGEIYHFDYTYDTRNRRVTLVVNNRNNVEVGRLGGAPNVNNITIGANEKMIWDFGFNGSNPAEPPTIGWGYQDLFVEFIP